MTSKAERQQLDEAERQKLDDQYSELMDHVQARHKEVIARAERVLEEAVLHLNLAYAIELAKLTANGVPITLLGVFEE